MGHVFSFLLPTVRICQIKFLSHPWDVLNWNQSKKYMIPDLLFPLMAFWFDLPNLQFCIESTLKSSFFIIFIMWTRFYSRNWVIFHSHLVQCIAIELPSKKHAIAVLKIEMLWFEEDTYARFREIFGSSFILIRDQYIYGATASISYALLTPNAKR